MGKRSFSILLALALVAGVFSALPAKAQEAPTTIPAVVNIEDASGDGNGLNDQGFGGICIQAPACIPEAGDNSGGGIGAADILKVWFTNTAESVSAHILTTFPPPNMTPGFGLLYRVRLNDNCTYLQGLVPSNTYAGAQKANVREFCDGTATTEGGEITIETLEDGTGITTLKYPLDLHPALTMGAKLTTPNATTAAASGTDAPALYAPMLDDTEVGTDYTIASGTVSEPTEEKPDSKAKKGGKGKGKEKAKKPKKKKKAKKPKKPPADVCPAYVPGEEGAEAETSVVTDAATAEAPLVVELTAGPGLTADISGEGLYDETTSVYQNVQVDSAGTSAGLYVRVEFADRHDYDLYLNYPSGDRAAASGDFNTGYGTPVFTCGDNCEGGSNFEQVNGIITKDCAGYTARISSFLTTGGTVTLSLWLGDGTADPAPPGSDASALFYELMGL